MNPLLNVKTAAKIAADERLRLSLDSTPNMRRDRSIIGRLKDTEERRRMFGQALIFVLCLAGVLVVLAVFTWLSGWWPDKLIPWLPFERV